MLIRANLRFDLHQHRTAAMPATRSPAQIEASRRNGAHSKGPVTADGKARASRNALKHGLCAMEHLVLEDEVPDDLDALIVHLTDEVGAATEIEARLARRLAIAFWKGERAERIEVALFDAAPKIRPPAHGFQWEEADPLTTFDVRRFNAIRGQQAQIGREIRNCLKELRELRKDAAQRVDELESMSESEAESTLRNEPRNQLPANDDADAARESRAEQAAGRLRNEPDNPTESRRDEPNRLPMAGLSLVEGAPVADELAHQHRRRIG